MSEPPHPLSSYRRGAWVPAAVLAMGAGAAPDRPAVSAPDPPPQGIDVAIRASEPPRRIGLDRPVLGFGINAHHISNLSLYLEAVDAIANLGANTLLVVTPMFQERVDSSRIQFRPQKCPTDEQLKAILRRGRIRGLQTILLPIVLIEVPGPKDWRGKINPNDLDAWWASYELFLNHFLDIAIDAEVDVLSVGSELNSMEGELQRWRRTIDHARSRFDGNLTYSANWDRYQRVTFWSWLDFISVSAYFELARDDPDAPVGTLAAAWRRERRTLLEHARRHDRSLLLMEMGYPSVPWAAAHPWNYVADPKTVADHEAQVRCYRAFFEAWAETVARPGSRALGFNCYFWDPYHSGGPDDTGYGVRGKPAERVIAASFARIRKTAGEQKDSPK